MKYVIPGERLCSYEVGMELGPGTFVKQNQVYSSILGSYDPELNHLNSTSKMTTTTTTTTSLVKNGSSLSSNENKNEQRLRPTVQGFQSRSILPSIGSQVTGQVKRINSKMAILAIRLVEDIPVKEEFEGIIRIEHVRASQTDTLQMQHCFRPGDIVRADVISLGESQSYILSTARNDLGVIYAQSSSTRATMIPISWEEMQCPDTGVIEKRKVCRIDIENTTSS